MIWHGTGYGNMKGICFVSFQEGSSFHGETTTVSLVPLVL